MNTPVSFKIKQLLFDKKWRYELTLDEGGQRVENSLAEQRWNEGDISYVEIAISDIILWLYDNHGIWISVSKDWDKDTLLGFESVIDDNDGFIDCGTFKTPTEAYEAAIIHTLNNNIK